jgi:hypothetical protein
MTPHANPTRALASAVRYLLSDCMDAIRAASRRRNTPPKTRNKASTHPENGFGDGRKTKRPTVNSGEPKDDCRNESAVRGSNLHT